MEGGTGVKPVEAQSIRGAVNPTSGSLSTARGRDQWLSLGQGSVQTWAARRRGGRPLAAPLPSVVGDSPIGHQQSVLGRLHRGKRAGPRGCSPRATGQPVPLQVRETCPFSTWRLKPSLLSWLVLAPPCMGHSSASPSQSSRWDQLPSCCTWAGPRPP